MPVLCNLFSDRQVFKIESDSGHEVLLLSFWVNGETIGSKLLVESAVTYISVHVSLLGLTGSLNGSASSVSGIGRCPSRNA